MRGYEIVENWVSCKLEEFSIIDLQYMVDDLVGIVRQMEAAQQSVYVISKQFHEEFYIFGIFTADELDSALTALAQESINEAQESKDDLWKWYENNHLTHYRERCEYGCEHLPAHLSLPIIEYSKTMFTVSKIEIGKVFAKGIYI